MLGKRASVLGLLLLLAAGCVNYGESPTDAPEEDPGPPPVMITEVGDSSLHWVRANRCEDGSPMSLTASDGTGLELQALDAQGYVEGPLAFTELKLRFANPEARTLEGRFSITLPPGAVVSRFAMKIGETWQEGEVVERQAARVAYEDFLHRKQDPALLEQEAGNVFRARVFPIPAEADKELIVSYSQELANAAEPYRLGVCGLPRLGRLDVGVTIAAKDGPRRLELHERDHAPRRDLEARVGTGGADGLTAGDLVVARVRPRVTTGAAAMERLTILFDTSASRALDFEGQVQRLGRLIKRLDRSAVDGIELAVVAMDQDIEVVYRGPAGSFGPKHEQALRARGALGATDLARAFERAAEQGVLHERVLLVGDGVLTAGDVEPAKIETAVARLSEHGVLRVDAMVDGGIQDRDLLTGLVRAGLQQDGIVADARMRTSEVVDKLGRATKSGVAVRVPGAQWVWPRTLDGVQTGDEVVVYAKLTQGEPFEVQLTGAELATPSPKLRAAARPLLQRAVAQAEITALTEEISDLDPTASQRRAALHEQIVDVSTRHRVLSPYTALLVLETEADYERFGIDRRSLADILTLGPDGIDVIQRRGRQGELAIATEQEEIVDDIPRPDDDQPAFDGKKDKGKDRPAPSKRPGMPKPKSEAEAMPKTGGTAVYSFEDDDIAGDADGRPLEEMKRLDGGERPALQAPAAEPPPPPGDEMDEDLFVQEVERADREMDMDEAPRRRRRARARRFSARRSEGRAGSAPEPQRERPKRADPYEGRFAKVMTKLQRRKVDAALTEARAWRASSPGDVLALIALGEALEAKGKTTEAARAYGSVIDLFPSRADLRRMAGERLDRLDGVGRRLSIDTYRKALEQRPDHASAYRLLAYALVKAGRHAEAFELLVDGLERQYPGGRFLAVKEIMAEDLAIIGRAWVAKNRKKASYVDSTLTRLNIAPQTTASTRFVLHWETDANDVDLHVYDAKGGHAWYSSKALPSGGRLYADVTTGYGPECFAVEGKAKAGPYRLQAHYYSRGPMGYGMGKLEVVEHDGRGNLRFVEQPFVMMKDDAWVDLVTVR